MTITDEKLLIFDGACGSNLHAEDLPADPQTEKYKGCTEFLNLSAPKVIAKLHRSFLDAGANVIETNTFGATRIVLAEWGLENQVDAINLAAVRNARAGIGDSQGKYIAGSIGPTTKLPSLGHIAHETMRSAYKEQATALITAGVDLLIIETCQDLMQAKIAVIAAREALKQTGKDLPIMLSVTIETTGTMLLGTDIEAVISTFEPFNLFSLGLNCATGPGQMDLHIKHLSKHWNGRISIIPNAGIPEIRNGQAFFPLEPSDFATQIKRFVDRDNASIVGGCCGTTPSHIKALAQALKTTIPKKRTPKFTPSLSSLYHSVMSCQEIPPLIIGERMNTHGSRKFKEYLLAEDLDGAAAFGVKQEKKGAHLLDICVAYAGRSEKNDMTGLITKLNTSSRAPLVIDSTKPETIESSLAIIPGRCLINSINLEDGGVKAQRVLRSVKKHGAAVIALTIGPNGMAMTADDKVLVAKQLHDLAVNDLGLRPSDLFIDALTFTIGSGDKTLTDSAVQTLEAIRRIKTEISGVFTSLGVSNISFGLPPGSRKILNSVFLHEAIKAGLDAAIIDSGKILPMTSISKQDKNICLDLLLNRPVTGSQTPLAAFIDHFNRNTDKKKETSAKTTLRTETALEELIMTGDGEKLQDLLEILLVKYEAVEIVNLILVPSMRKVGVLFGRGEMLLPFVLQSAEIMKKAVLFLEPYLKQADVAKSTKILLATVAGDVHDIGKNLVDIILSNNGYRVLNLGINVPTETIIEKAAEHEVDIIGLSGLLVNSALEMQDSLSRYRESGLNIPILLGGAALSANFVAKECVPNYDKPVVYCADAFAGLNAVLDMEKGKLISTVVTDRPQKAASDIQSVTSLELTRDNIVPSPPFLGVKHKTDINVKSLFPLINEQALIRGRWGFKKGRLSDEAYQTIINNKALPALADIKQKCLDENLLEPKVSYGFFKCRSEGDTVILEHKDKEIIFNFPRQKHQPFQCLADYFKSASLDGDIIGLFIATCGDEIMKEVGSLFEANNYKDYLMLHGFAVETAEATAQYWHDHMRDLCKLQRPHLPFGKSASGQGARFSFGYSSCPNLEGQALIFDLLKPENIGVTLTKNLQMNPENTVSAIVVHHPQAGYFSV